MSFSKKRIDLKNFEWIARSIYDFLGKIESQKYKATKEMVDQVALHDTLSFCKRVLGLSRGKALNTEAYCIFIRAMSFAGMDTGRGSKRIREVSQCLRWFLKLARLKKGEVLAIKPECLCTLICFLCGLIGYLYSCNKREMDDE